jgi:hypothetical protein
VIVDDLSIMRIAVRPPKTDTILVVHPNAVLPFAVILQRFQPIPRRHGKIVQLQRGIQNRKLPER